MEHPTPQEINTLVSLFKQRRFSELEPLARQLTERFPRHSFGWKVLGIFLQCQGRMDESLAPLQKAAELSPEDANSHYNLSITLQKVGKLAEAEESCNKALSIRPDYAEVYRILGSIYENQGDLTKAEAHWRCAVEIKPDFEGAHSDLGVILEKQGRLAEAEASYRRALEIKPDFTEAHSNLIFAMNYATRHHSSAQFEEACHYGRVVAKMVTGRLTAWQCSLRPKRLRVGLVSGDLHNHPVGYFLESILAHIDPTRIELIAYLTRRKDDDLTTRIQPYFLDWKSLYGLSDEEAARLIVADGVHLLLDLSGHTGANRLEIFAWKPAPVQASWLGYFATTGVAEMDWLLADEVGVPSAHQIHFTEKIWYLPDTRLCFTPPKLAPEVTALPALDNQFITIGCFQNLSKIGDEVLCLWSRVLQAIPNARIRLQNRLFNDDSVRERFAARLDPCGIDSSRVTLHGPSNLGAYLAAYAEVDFILDTFPYPGGTTTCEALWMGVPTLTLAGDSLLSRQGASLLTAAGLADWVAENEDDYVAKAVLHATDLERLSSLRGKLRQQVMASPLFDAPRFAKNLETALWGMWSQWQERQETMTKTFLHVGCGPSRKAQTTRGFNTSAWQEVRLDIDVNVKPDIVGTMLDMSGVADSSIDAIFSSHNIEHLYPHEVPMALQEFLRVLKPDGYLVLACPDLQSVARLIADDKLTEAAYISPAGPIAPLDILYGHRPQLARGNLYMAHHCGFTEKVLVNTLSANGFQSVYAKARAPYFDLWAVASKSLMSEEEIRGVAGEHFPTP